MDVRWARKGPLGAVARWVATLSPELRRAGRVIGIAQGMSNSILGFVGVFITLMAFDLNTADDGIQLAATLASFVMAMLLIEQIVTRVGVLPRWMTIGMFSVGAAGVMMVALAPHVWLTYVGMALTALPTRALSPVRSAVARRFEATGADGTFMSVTLVWHYAIQTVATLAISWITFTVPRDWWLDGWRIATALLAIGVGAVAVLLWRCRDLLQGETGTVERISLSELWDKGRIGEVRRMLLAVAASNVTAALLWLSLEPRMVAIGLAREAPLIVGALNVAWGIGLPQIVRYGRLSDKRVRRAIVHGSLWSIGSSALALGTLAPMSRWLILLATATLVIGVGIGGATIYDAARTYASRQGIEGEALVTLVGACSGTAGGFLAALLGSWTWAVVVMVPLALLAWLVLRRREPADSKLVAVKVQSPSKEMRLRLTRGPREASALLFFFLGDKQIGQPVTVTDDDRAVVETPQKWDDPSSTSVPVWRWRVWPPERRRRPRRKESALFPGARVPLLKGGMVFGHLTWHGPSGGRWTINEDGDTVLTSWYIAHRLLTIRVEHHNA